MGFNDRLPSLYLPRPWVRMPSADYTMDGVYADIAGAIYLSSEPPLAGWLLPFASS